MKKIKVISGTLITFASLLTCKQANSLPIYVLPPSAPSNWIVNPANPLYSPWRPTPDDQDQPRNDNNRTYSPNPGSSNGRQIPESDSREIANLLWKKGNDQLQRGNFKEAALVLTMAISVQPKVAEVYVTRGIAYGYSGDLQSALKDFNQAIRLKPNLAEAYGGRGAVYNMLGDWQSSLRDFDQAIRLKPSWAEAYVNRGTAYGNLGDWQSSLRDSDQAIRLKPSWAEAYVDRGQAYYILGNLKSALRDTSQAIRLNPNLAVAYDNRAFLFYDQSDMVGAINDWKKALSLNSRFAEPYMALAVASYKQGNINEARTLHAKAIQIDRRYGNLQYLKRDAHWSSIILRDASAFFQNAPLTSQSNSSSYRPTQASANTRTQPKEIIGVGIQLSQNEKNKKLMVVSAIDGTPAANAGILPKDAITQIDGLSTQGMTVEQAVKLIKGTAGTDVTLTVLRNGQPLKFRLTRVKFITQVQSNNP